ncbi:PREDICTED: thrombin-like enzyme 2 [Ceratosolen solmsi marchali]|uniref:Thrombin-like enzyme 2 n=1 Tax=Ceratosolen solmsi marchali TaxID=326594 RepID=A0AAJ6VLQ6_9HYME|nr:PREDICTED: thrombin-like enzyme 2 [Ceratosolen solmsi marchali]
MMRTAQLIVLRMRECSSKLSRILAELILIHNRYICTCADPHVVMNHGDSGNPVFYNGMVIAIHKSTMPFPGEVVNPQKINIHTTIHYYRNFITATTDSNFTRKVYLLGIQNDFVVTKPMFGSFVRLAEENEFVFAVSMVKINNIQPIIERDFICSGALVTKHNVLTSAHCTESYDPTQVLIYAGSINILRSRRYKISWWITYNNWAYSMNMLPRYLSNDIANIRLRRPVHQTLVPIPISNLTNVQLYGQYVDIAAWSIDSEDLFPVKLMTVTLNVLSLNECMDRIEVLHGERVSIEERHLCSFANPYAVMSFGNSGAPIIHLGKVVGIHKATIPFVNEPYNPHKLNIHASIDFYRDFIVTVIAPDYRYLVN